MGIVSHDLRNPLNAIMLSAAILTRKHSLADDAMRTVVRIQNAADRATQLVADLLDLTQARLGGGIPVQPAPADLHALLRTATDEVEAAHPSRHIEIVEERGLTGSWDAARLSQVLQNLVTNALKYSPPDSVVRITTGRVNDDTVVRVHNDGPPIAPEKLEAIFEPFQRAGQTDRVSRSVGLGLFIARQIVEAHHGTLGVTSTADDGTEFTIRLPSARTRESPADHR